jgi:DUF4097 and DUF4098 domain-containing protein YvlB
MESRNRNVWIIVAIVVVLLLCCCIAAIAAAAAGWFAISPVRVGGLAGSESERYEQSFDVGSAPKLTVDNFAGSVTVRAGGEGQIQVAVTKKASGRTSLDQISVEMNPQDGGLLIRTTKPNLSTNVSVQLEITAPANTQLDLHTGAGSIDAHGFTSDAQVNSGAGSLTIQDLSGSLDAHTGAGSIDVIGATGLVRLDTGAGSISYQGTPQGDCRFESGTGSIQLTLPADLEATVDLGTGVGTVDVGFVVDGQVTKREVRGTIGRGDQARIYAHTGTGSIDVISR